MRKTETKTWMSLEIEIIRDQDFPMNMTYFFLYGEWKFLPRQICQSLFTAGDDGHAIELEE